MTHSLRPTTELSQRIASAYPALSKGHRQLADHVIHHPLDAATMTIEALAKACDTSVATATRFVRTLGYDHFGDFRAALGDALRIAMAPVETLSQATEQASQTPASVFCAALDRQIENLRETRSLVEGEKVARAIEMMMTARQVYVVASGASYHVASYLEDALSLYLGPRIVLVTSRGGLDRAVHFLGSVTPEDLVIGISVRRYSKFTAELLHFARERTAHLLAITDSATSPVARVCDLTLFAPSDGGHLPNSPTALFAIADALVAAIAQQQPGSAAALKALSTKLFWTFQE
ncbi:MAG: MurR/RpiR family transcriptional regulator [Proteobacteria bacterium]|nr:MurR/RpiR family transcriptional regulator [Pseudomonadota bacterium]